jgi:hypothetical protein
MEDTSWTSTAEENIKKYISIGVDDQQDTDIDASR